MLTVQQALKLNAEAKWHGAVMPQTTENKVFWPFSGEN